MADRRPPSLSYEEHVPAGAQARQVSTCPTSPANMHSVTSWRRAGRSTRCRAPAAPRRRRPSHGGHDGAGERVDSGGHGLGRFGPARIASMSSASTPSVPSTVESERDAVGVVDGDADRHTGHLAVHGVDGRPTPRDAARRRRRGGSDSAVAAARFGTNPRSAAMPSSIGREAVGALSGVRMWRFMATIIRTWPPEGHSPGGKRRRAGPGVASPPCRHP